MPPFRRRTILASLIVSVGALAQEAPPAQVDVRGNLAAYDPRRDDTAARIVVRHEDIVKYGDTNLLDVLKRVPGVTVSGSAGRGGEVRLQGLGNGFTQVLVDGERIPPGFAFDTLAPDSVERIEVRRAASAELSTQAIAGTINIVLKRAVRKAEREFKAGVEGGRDTRSPNASLRLADERSGMAYSLVAGAMRNDFDGDVPDREEGRDAAGRTTLLRTTAGHEHGHFASLNVVPRVTWTLDGGDTLGLEGLALLNRFRVGVQAPTTALVGDPAPYPRQDIACATIRARCAGRWSGCTTSRRAASWRRKSMRPAATRTMAATATPAAIRPSGCSAGPSIRRAMTAASARAARRRCRCGKAMRWPSAGMAAGRTATTRGANATRRNRRWPSPAATSAIRAP